MSFLTGEWRRLIMANNEIDPAVLAPFEPPNTELDSHNGNPRSAFLAEGSETSVEHKRKV